MLSQLKNEYNKIEATQEFTERIDSIMKKENRRSMWQKVALSAAAVVLSVGIFTTTLNVNPVVAENISSIKIFEKLVSVLTFGKYEVKTDSGMEAKIVTPQIQGLLDKELESRINTELRDQANLVIAEFEADMKELEKEYPGEEVHMGVDYDYIVKTDNDKYLAIDMYRLNVVGSSSTTHKFITIDKKAGKILTLQDVYGKKDYVTPISKYIKADMERQNKDEEGMFFINSEIPADDFVAIKPDQNFYINDKGNVVISFDKYEVAAGAGGCPEFEIPANLF